MASLLQTPPPPAQETRKRGRPKKEPAQVAGGGGEKESRKFNFLKKIFNGDEAAKTASFHTRKPTLKKKAKELETLCGIDVTVVCHDAYGNVDFWPEDRSEVRERCFQYLKLSSREKKEWNYKDLLHSKKKNLMKKKEKGILKGKSRNIDGLMSSLSNWLDGLSGDSLRDSVAELETKIKSFKQIIESRREEKMIDECFSHLSDFDQNDIYSCLESSGLPQENIVNMEQNINYSGWEFAGEAMAGADRVYTNVGEEQRLEMINYLGGLGQTQISGGNCLISITDCNPISTVYDFNYGPYVSTSTNYFFLPQSD